MDVILGLLTNILEEGFIYGIMALGVYITYSILDFPDLSVDGTFPLGGVVTAVCILGGINPFLACFLAFLAGAAAGCVTGLLHVKLKITNLLSGILVMTGLWSVNLAVSGGSAIVTYFNKNTIFNQGLASVLPKAYRVMIVAAVLCIGVKLLLDVFFKTKFGMTVRATGDNVQFITNLGIDPGTIKIVGLALGNGLTALSGAVLSQQAESANIASGTGMVVLGLASVIIGTSIFKKVTFVKATSAVIFGSIIYKTCLSVAMNLGLPTNYLKLLMTVIFVIALVGNNFLSSRKSKGGGRA